MGFPPLLPGPRRVAGVRYSCPVTYTIDSQPGGPITGPWPPKVSSLDRKVVSSLFLS